MQYFKSGLFTMLGMLTGIVLFTEGRKLFDKTTTEKCKEAKAEETVTTKN